MRHVRTVWADEWPSVQPIEAAIGHSLRKSNTFEARDRPTNAPRLYLWFQHSCYPWAVGDFTVNLVLADPGATEPSLRLGLPGDFAQLVHGSYRLGDLIYGLDKWWCLRNNDRPYPMTWRAQSYGDETDVFREALADVSRDLRIACARVGIDLGT
jgi:hypothetical protein